MHLFLIHNHSSYYTAVAAALHARLEPEEVVFLTARHHESYRPRYRLLPVSTSVPRTWRTWHARRFLHAFDAALRKLVHGRPFHWYVPHTRFRYVQLVKTHPLCSGFSFLEEGLAAYRSPEQVEELYRQVPRKLRDRACYGDRIPTMRFFDPGHEHAYGLYEDAFLGLPGRVILRDWQRNVVRRPDLSLRHVLVFDGSSSAGIVRFESILAGLRRLLEEFRRWGLREVHYKWHPAQMGRSPERPRILEAFARHAAFLRTVPVPADTSLEEIALSCPEVEFLVSTSSAGFYAALCGRPVRSFGRFVAEVDPDYWSVLRALPHQYWQHVTLL